MQSFQNHESKQNIGTSEQRQTQNQDFQITTNKNNKFRNIIIATLVIIIMYFGYKAIFQKNTYQGFYYIEGCLVCDNYIKSPVLQSAEDCVRWAEGLQVARQGSIDSWECGKNCRQEGEFSVCKETFGSEGTGDHSL